MKFSQKTRYTPLADARDYFNRFENDALYEAVSELLTVDAVPPVTRAPLSWTKRTLKEYLDEVVRTRDDHDRERIGHMRVALDHITSLRSIREHEQSKATHRVKKTDTFWFLDLQHVKVATEVGSVEPVAPDALGVLQEFAGKKYTRSEAMALMAKLVEREPYLGRTRELHVRLCYFAEGAIRRDIPYIFVASRGDNDQILYRNAN